VFVQGLTVFDVLLSSIYILIVLLIAGLIKQRRKQLPYYKYFVPFVLFKSFAAILFVLIHIYVYGGGDTFLYFAGGKYIAQQIIQHPISGLSYLFASPSDIGSFAYSSDFDASYFFRATDIFTLSKLASIFCLLSFQQLMTANILFSLFSAIGIWKLYLTLCKLYPSLYKHFAIGVLFYPTIGVWGSGTLKDPVALMAIGIIFYATYNLVKRKKIISSIVLISLSVLICLKLKPYILYTFIPAMLLWVQGNISQGVKTEIIKYFVTPLIIAIFLASGYYFMQAISQSAGKYSLDNVQEVVEGFHSWHTYLADSRNQSGYDLGEIEFTPTGILTKIPQALFVTFYRPFIIGDIRNAPTAFEGIQSFILLIITLVIFFRIGFFNFFKILFTNNNVRAFMIFSLLFGAAVGFSSYNFGALSRYKIPCLPFFTASLAIIYYQGKMKLQLRKQGKIQ
jgi:hypothetical protein